MSRHVVLVLGGARSGKSAYAEARVTALTPPWTYLATGQAGDAEMAARIRHHQDRRAGGWRTVEEPLDLVGQLEALARPGHPVLVDCLTLWVSNLMGKQGDVDAETARLAEALPRLTGFVVLVSNEVGLGIVPDNAAARAFRDQAGRLNQAVAAVADEVVFLAAGLPMVMKTPPGERP